MFNRLSKSFVMYLKDWKTYNENCKTMGTTTALFSYFDIQLSNCVLLVYSLYTTNNHLNSRHSVWFRYNFNILTSMRYYKLKYVKKCLHVLWLTLVIIVI